MGQKIGGGITTTSSSTTADTTSDSPPPDDMPSRFNPGVLPPLTSTPAALTLFTTLPFPTQIGLVSDVGFGISTEEPYTTFMTSSPFTTFLEATTLYFKQSDGHVLAVQTTIPVVEYAVFQTSEPMADLAHSDRCVDHSCRISNAF